MTRHIASIAYRPVLVWLAPVCFMLSGVGGCRTFTPPAQDRLVADGNNPGLYLLDYEATRRGTYIYRDSSGKTRIAAEPPPDVALESTAKLVASLSDAITKTKAGELDGSVTESIVKLTERTQAVVIMRDAMFRLAEMHLNDAIDKDNYLILYNKALAGALVLGVGDNKEAVELIIASFVDSMNAERIAQLTKQLREIQGMEASTPRESENNALAAQAITSRIARLAEQPSAIGNIAESLFTDHPTVPVRKVNEQLVIELALRNESGSRATNNFNVESTGTKKFRVVARNVPPALEGQLSFQLKRDEKWGTDPNLGAPFKVGDLIEISGARLYLAERGTSMDQLLSEAPKAVILLIEEGLAPETVP